MTTRVSTDGIADDAVTAAKIAAGAVGTAKLADGGVTAAKIAAGAVPIIMGVRQTVQGGPIDGSGLPSFLPASSGTLTLTTQNITSGYPLVVSASSGFGAGCERTGSVTGNSLSWTLAANSGVNYLYIDVAADGTLTADKTTTAPVYSETATAGTNTFNYTTMKMFTTGTTTGYRVFVGEATAGATAISGVIAYGYNGKYSGYGSAAAPLVYTAIVVPHLLGIKPRVFRALAECVTTDSAWNVGDIIEPVTWTGSYVVATPLLASGTQLKARCAAGWYANLPTTGVMTILDVAKWKMWFEAERGW